MEDRKVARRYANALFQAALQNDVVSSVQDDLSSIVHLLQADADFRHFMIAPYAGREEKLGIMEKVFSDRITALTMQLIRVMLQKGRENEIAGTYEEFVDLRRVHESVVHAVVASAIPLDDTQRTAILSTLENSLKKKIEADFQVEPSLIGGVRVHYGNFVIDGTVRGKFRKLRDHLTHDVLKQV